MAALRGGWRTLKANIGSSIVLLLIQQGLVLVGYVALAVGAVILFVPAIVVLIATSAGAAGIIVAAVTAWWWSRWGWPGPAPWAPSATPCGRWATSGWPGRPRRR